MMHQRRYAGEILKRFEMQDCNPTSTPAEPRMQLLKDTDEDDMIKAEESSGISAVSLVIGSDNYEPYNYIDESGENVGIDVDIAKEACRRLGITPVFKQITWDRKDSFLDSNEIDCLWGSFTMSIL